MDWLSFRRLNQVIRYGWTESKVIAKDSSKSRLSVFWDILRAYHRYHIFSNQYRSNGLWRLTKVEQGKIATPIGQENLRRDNWVRANYHNWKFIRKWTNLKYELSPSMQRKRERAYAKEFNAGEGLIVQFNVHIHREHYLDGTIKMGKNVLLAKNVFIDYSGELIIHDNVSIANGVIIETHTHPLEKSRQVPVPSRLEIGDGVKVLSRSYIADTCHSIGRYARIGAGTYVRNNIPPYAIVMGNPAKIIGFLYSPEEMVEFERDKYPESERTSLEQYTLWYEKYFRSRSKEIKSFIKL